LLLGEHVGRAPAQVVAAREDLHDRRRDALGDLLEGFAESGERIGAPERALLGRGRRREDQVGQYEGDRTESLWPHGRLLCVIATMDANLPRLLRCARPVLRIQAPRTLIPKVRAARARSRSCVAKTSSWRVRSCHTSAVARCSASRVPSGVGNGSDARASTGR
jgi:hypothetical protein